MKSSFTITFKASVLLLSFIFCFLFSHAQAPQAFKYQTVVRNSSNQIIPNQVVGLRISILQGSDTGTAIYVETHAATTNTLGIVNLEIGNGTLVSGNFSTISWGTNMYFVKIELDPAGSTAYQLMGTAQLLSVPYALYAASGNQGPQGPAGPTGPTGATGATGPQGPTGATGATGPQGPAGPAGPVGATGATGSQGPAGADGKTVLNGTTNPTAGIGVNGDFYINTSTNLIFGPKAGGVWPTGVSLVGPTGPTGATGATGATGPAGSANISGTTNYLVKFTGATTGGNSIIYDNGSKIGIGTTSPATKLEASGTSNQFLRVTSTTAGTVGIELKRNGSTEYDWGIQNASGSLLFYLSGDDLASLTNVMSINSPNGWLGVGTITPSAQLHTTGTLRFEGAGTPGNGKVLTSDVNGNATWQNLPAGLTGAGANGKIAFWNGTNNITHNTNFSWDNVNSRLGIGTSSPIAELHVQRSNTLTNSQVWLKQLGTGDATLGFSIGSTQDWAMGIDQSDMNKFKISPSYANSTNPVLTLQTNGRVGLGTAAPTAFFHVDDATNATAYLVRAEFSGSTVTTDPVGFQATCNPSGVAGYGYGASFTAGYKGLAATVSSGTTTFSTYGADIYVQGTGSGARYGGYFYSYGSTGNTGSLYGIYSTATGTGTTKYAGYFSGNVTVTGTFSNPSDLSLKTNLKSLNGSAEKLKNLPVYSYEYLPVEGMNLPEGNQFGFIAQDLEQIFPELVSVQKHPLDDPNIRAESKYLEYKGINYIGMIPVLTKAIQEQQEMIESQQMQIDILRSELIELKRMIEKE